MTEKSPSNKNGTLLIKSFFKLNEVSKKNDKIKKRDFQPGSTCPLGGVQWCCPYDVCIRRNSTDGSRRKRTNPAARTSSEVISSGNFSATNKLDSDLKKFVVNVFDLRSVDEFGLCQWLLRRICYTENFVLTEQNLKLLKSNQIKIPNHFISLQNHFFSGKERV